MLSLLNLFELTHLLMGSIEQISLNFNFPLIKLLPLLEINLRC